MLPSCSQKLVDVEKPLLQFRDYHDGVMLPSSSPGVGTVPQVGCRTVIEPGPSGHSG